MQWTLSRALRALICLTAPSRYRGSPYTQVSNPASYSCTVWLDAAW